MQKILEHLNLILIMCIYMKQSIQLASETIWKQCNKQLHIEQFQNIVNFHITTNHLLKDYSGI